MHSAKFEKVKSHYNRGLWTAEMVRLAVKKSWITEDECIEIIGVQD